MFGNKSKVKDTFWDVVREVKNGEDNIDKIYNLISTRLYFEEKEYVKLKDLASYELNYIAEKVELEEMELHLYNSVYVAYKIIHEFYIEFRKKELKKEINKLEKELSRLKYGANL